MDDTNNQAKTAQEWFIEGGCGCAGAAIGVILFIAVLILLGASYFALLFTAPPMERISQINQFLEEGFAPFVVIGLLVIMIFGGGFGYWLGTVINTARRAKNDPIE